MVPPGSTVSSAFCSVAKASDDDVPWFSVSLPATASTKQVAVQSPGAALARATSDSASSAMAVRTPGMGDKVVQAGGGRQADST